MISKREDVREAEVVALHGRDMVTLIINGIAFDMSSAVANAIAGDMKKAVKRVKGGN